MRPARGRRHQDVAAPHRVAVGSRWYQPGGDSHVTWEVSELLYIEHSTSRPFVRAVKLVCGSQTRYLSEDRLLRTLTQAPR